MRVRQTDIATGEEMEGSRGGGQESEPNLMAYAATSGELNQPINPCTDVLGQGLPRPSPLPALSVCFPPDFPRSSGSYTLFYFAHSPSFSIVPVMTDISGSIFVMGRGEKEIEGDLSRDHTVHRVLCED